MRGLQKKYLKQKRFIIIGTILVGIALLIMINASTIIVHADTEQDYVYESIKVMPDDSLWSISKEYCPDNIDINEYIDMVEELNGISSDYIVEGNYILIPIYK